MVVNGLVPDTSQAIEGPLTLYIKVLSHCRGEDANGGDSTS